MEKQFNILLVDDDRSMSPLIKEYLEAKGLKCHLHHNAFDALEDFQKNKFNLCILDVKMPMKNGYELAEELKSFNPDIPFLFLSGQTQKEDRIKGLEHGADDYITKPFSMQELFLRLQAILKRTAKFNRQKVESSKFDIGDYHFNPTTREVNNQQSTQKLSAIESKLLHMFCESIDGIIMRDNALKQIWSDEHSFRERSLNVYVSKLRQILKDDPRIEILNIHGTGYQLLIRE